MTIARIFRAIWAALAAIGARPSGQASVCEPKPTDLDAVFRAKEAARLKAYRASPQYQAKKAAERAARETLKAANGRSVSVRRVYDARTYAYDAPPDPLKKNLKKEKEVPTPVPKNFQPDDETWRFAIEKLRSAAAAEAELAGHIEHCRSHDIRFVDHNAAFRRRVLWVVTHRQGAHA
jgi:hypothetical protein